MEAEAYVASAVVDLQKAGLKDEAKELLNAPASRQRLVANCCFSRCARKVGWNPPDKKRKALLKAMVELDNVIDSAKLARSKAK